ncbi:hypothetical protein [Qipengyuania gelatinilytica]|uniref:Flap endonuclease-1-like 5' DNA nuclease n=1 Tax=Qipengyuania gelatinilytica TaxID=2867231 RepID=A0ABX9A4P7_9SPHN|nr:hypothetical protein [Qipengyuania gelatinilytica]QZD94873.1 hypothetical protein K3136_12430 [Qipengyuania gelatinilytica]
MSELLAEHWILLVIALVIGLIVAWFLLRTNRRTRVTGASKDVLDEGAERAQRNSALVDAPPAAAKDPEPVVKVSDGNGDDLTRIKGVGPKLAALLESLGVTSFAQIADWDDAEIDRIDAQLGRFEGRIRRDDWVGQARLLADGKDAEFTGKYGAGA